MYWLTTTVAFLASFNLLATASTAQTSRPNVILMMADDLAYDDLSCYGSDRIQSPVLDKMASEGMRLTSFYAGASVCSPSRMALLSGAYPARLGWQQGVLGYGMKPNTGLANDVFTLAELFRTGGYRTAISGKWHVGDRNMRPHRQGFDSTFYLLASNNIGRDIYREDTVIHQDFDNRRLSEAITDEVLRVIHSDAKEPFFIYVPFTAPHFPAEAHPDWKGPSDDKLAEYVEVVEELDYRVGQILEAVKTKGIDNETLIIFISDNGAQAGQRTTEGSGPWSGMKWSSREGGTRVPAILRWPGVIQPGQICDEMIAAIDLYPTLAQACSLQLNLPPEAQRLDGVSIWETITGTSKNHARNELLYWHGFGQATAIRQGDYKLFFGSGEKHSADPNIAEGPALFNLVADPGESNDIRRDHPERVQKLLELARKRLTEINENATPIGQWEGSPAADESVDAKARWGKWLQNEP